MCVPQPAAAVGAHLCIAENGGEFVLDFLQEGFAKHCGVSQVRKKG